MDDLEEAAKKIDQLRKEFLDTPDLVDGLAPVAEQMFLLAVCSLEQAQRQMMLACLNQRLALGNRSK